jgi:hypothetical protein
MFGPNATLSSNGGMNTGNLQLSAGETQERQIEQKVLEMLNKMVASN